MESSDNTQTKVVSVNFRNNKNTEYTTLAKKCINTPSTTPMYSSSYYSNSHNSNASNSTMDGYINCTFYEWSRIDDKTRQFFNMKELKDFIKECDIVLDKEDEDRIKRGYTWFITCVPGERTLIISTTFYGLQCLLETAYKNKNLNVPKSYYSTLNY